MSYADFDYYKTEYGGGVFESEGTFKPYERKAERRIDTATSGKLTFAFPTEEKPAQAVKDCLCELAEFLYQVDVYKNDVMNAAGVVKQADGTVKGKAISSVSSGSESISYSAKSADATVVTEAAKDKKVLEVEAYSIIKDSLAGIGDANGVNLLYAGAYPGRECIWE